MARGLGSDEGLVHTNLVEAGELRKHPELNWEQFVQCRERVTKYISCSMSEWGICRHLRPCSTSLLVELNFSVLPKLIEIGPFLS